MRRVVICLMVAILTLAGAASSAPQAHAAGRLRVSNPAPRQELSERPGWVSLAFDGTVKRSLLKVLVVDARGANVVVGELIYQGSAVLVQLNNELPRGTYTVKYQVDRKRDGQPEGGAFQFAYGKGRWTKIVASWSGTAQQPPEMANPDPMATGPVVVPTTTPPVVEVSDPASPTRTASPSPSRSSASPTETPTESPTPVETPSEEPTPEPTEPEPAGGPDPVPWIIGAAVLVAAGAGGWSILRRRRDG